MDIAKMREDLESWCRDNICEDCPLVGRCNTGIAWAEQSDKEIIEMWKEVFPNAFIPVTDGEKETAAEIISLKSQITQLQDVIADRTKDVQYYDAENKKLLEKLDVAERELEKANAVFKNEFEKRSSLQRQYDEIKIKNQNICSTIADMVRKIMQE